MKSPKMITALTPSVQSYRHFTGILAYGILFSIESNDDILASDFAHRKIYLCVEYSENPSSKECFLLEILKSQKRENFSIFRER